MKHTLGLIAGTLLLLCATVSRADDYSETIQLFKEAGASSKFFEN